MSSSSNKDLQIFSFFCIQAAQHRTGHASTDPAERVKGQQTAIYGERGVAVETTQRGPLQPSSPLAHLLLPLAPKFRLLFHNPSITQITSDLGSPSPRGTYGPFGHFIPIIGLVHFVQTYKVYKCPLSRQWCTVALLDRGNALIRYMLVRSVLCSMSFPHRFHIHTHFSEEGTHLRACT